LFDNLSSLNPLFSKIANEKEDMFDEFLESLDDPEVIKEISHFDKIISSDFVKYIEKENSGQK
jgi:hypothetical protein